MKEDKNKKAIEKAEYKKQLALIKSQYKQMLIDEEAKRKEPKIAPEGYFISLQNVNKVYDNYVQAVYDFNLDIKRHEFIVFVGPSGCGKSTTLRMIAGLEDITTGDLYIDGVFCNEKSAKERDVAMVFQNYALYPHMTVYKNMAFGLETRGYKKEDIDVAVKKAAEILQITEYLDRLPKALSGGQMQRVALGRAIVREAKVFLMDEPLSNLDAKLRVQMRSEIVKLHREINATTIYVTHDQTEAMTMADRIVVMRDGYIQQIGTPTEVYNNPSNVFVATFIGAPAMNLINARYEKGKILFPDGFTIKLTAEQIKAHDDFYKRCLEETKQKIENKAYELPDNHILLTHHKEKRTFKDLFKPRKIEHIETSEEKHAKLEELMTLYQNCLDGAHDVIFGIRPEDVHENYELPSSITKSSEIEISVDICELLGSEYQIHSDIWGQDVVSKCQVNKMIQTGDKLKIIFDLKKMHLFDSLNKKSIL